MRHHSPSRPGDRQRGGRALGHTASVESWSFWQGTSTPKADRVLERCSHKQSRETALQRGSSLPTSKPAAAPITEDQGKDKTTAKRSVYLELLKAQISYFDKTLHPANPHSLWSAERGQKSRHRVMVKDTSSKVKLFAWLSA